MFRIYTVLILVCLFIANLSHAFASFTDEANLRVLVSSGIDGNAIPGATLLLADQTDTLAAASDIDGYHQFSGLEPGDYHLTVSFLGYQTYEEEITLRQGQIKIQRVELAEGPEELDEIIVEDRRGAAHREAGMQTIRSQDIGRVPSPGPAGDLAAYLQTIPGVTAGGDRGGEVFIRGGTPSQNIIKVDHLPIVQPFHISNLFSAFPEEAIHNVDVYAGGFNAEYLGGTSSVIDVNLRAGNTNEFQGNAAFSPYMGSVHAEGPIRGDHESFLAIARYSVIDNLSEPLTGEHTPIEFYDLTGRYTFELFNLSCNTTAIHTSDSGQINPQRNLALDWTNTTVGTRCLVFDPRIDTAVDLSVGVTHFGNSEGTLTHTERESNITRIFTNANWDSQIFEREIELGLDMHLTSYDSRIDERFTTAEELESNLFGMSMYAQKDWHAAEHLWVTPSLGTQLSTNISVPTLEPRLRISYLPGGSGRNEISLSGGVYNQLQEAITDERDMGSVFRLWNPIDQDDPVPTAYHGILGYRHQLGSAFEASVEGYVKDHRNIPISQWSPEAMLEVQTALADGYSYGADLQVEFNQSPFYVLLSYAWANVTYEADAQELGAWLDEDQFTYNPAHDRRHQLNTIGSVTMGRYTFRTRWEFSTGQPFTQLYGHDLSLRLPDQYPTQEPGTALTLYREPYGGRMPAYHRLDASVDRTFNLSSNYYLDLEVGVINLYNRNNIMFFDIDNFERVDQMPMLPYLALKTGFN